MFYCNLWDTRRSSDGRSAWADGLPSARPQDVRCVAAPSLMGRRGLQKRPRALAKAAERLDSLRQSVSYCSAGGKEGILAEDSVKQVEYISECPTQSSTASLAGSTCLSRRPPHALPTRPCQSLYLLCLSRDVHDGDLRDQLLLPRFIRSVILCQ
eukprot:2029583-Amphidinium_carterae.1